MGAVTRSPNPDNMVTGGVSSRTAAPPRGARLASLVERNAFIVFVLALSGGVLALFARGGVVSDAWYSLASGRLISRSGIPHHDTWAVLTQGREWVDQQWLAHLGIYGVWTLGGWPLALMSVVVLYLAAFTIAAMAARLLGASERSVAIAAIPCFLVGSTNTVLRPQIPAYVLFALVLLLLLTDDRRQSNRVFLVFPLLVLWANLHGSVVLGAGLVALHGVTIAIHGVRDRAPKGKWGIRSGVLIVVPWICTLLSPYGLALPGYYQRTLGNSSFAHVVQEWSASTLPDQPTFFVVLLAGLWLVFRQRGSLGLFPQLAFVLAAIGGLLAQRNIVWFAILAAAILPSALDAAWPPSKAPRHHRINLALVAIGVAALVVAAAATAAHSRSWFEQAYPAGAAKAVASATSTDPRLEVFANERYADWLLFEDPQLEGRIAFDVRFELLSASQISTIFDFRAEHGLNWQRAARGYGLLVLDPAADKGAVKLFERLRHTQILYDDPNVVVLRVASDARAS